MSTNREPYRFARIILPLNNSPKRTLRLRPKFAAYSLPATDQYLRSQICAISPQHLPSPSPRQSPLERPDGRDGRMGGSGGTEVLRGLLTTLAVLFFVLFDIAVNPSDTVRYNRLCLIESKSHTSSSTGKNSLAPLPSHSGCHSVTSATN